MSSSIRRSCSAPWRSRFPSCCTFCAARWRRRCRSPPFDCCTARRSNARTAGVCATSCCSPRGSRRSCCWPRRSPVRTCKAPRRRRCAWWPSTGRTAWVRRAFSPGRWSSRDRPSTRPRAVSASPSSPSTIARTCWRTGRRRRGPCGARRARTGLRRDALRSHLPTGSRFGGRRDGTPGRRHRSPARGLGRGARNVGSRRLVGGGA